MAEIIVKQTVAQKGPTIIREVVVLPGIKGDKGDPFTYDDFTPEQIAELQRPATEAAETANNAALNANKAAQNINDLGEQLIIKESQRENAESLRKEAEEERETAEMSREQSFSQMQTTLKGIISDANTVISKATTAAGRAENAASEANTAATAANDAANNANQAAQNVDGRVTALEGKASQTYENLAAIEASGETNPNKIYIDGETMQPYIYKGGVFVPFSGGKPKGGYNRALFEAAGAVFNEDTGYYELYANEGGLTDITEDEMCDIYSTYRGEKQSDMSEKFSNSRNIRTAFKISNQWVGTNLTRCFQGCSKIQIVYVNVFISNMFNAFHGCVSLLSIKGILDLHYIPSNNSNYVDNAFNSCILLNDIKIKNLKTSLSFKYSENISKESIKYLVDNAANTSAITITVHPTTYGYLTGTILPTSQVGGTTEEWQAIVTTAQEKQITFATTE